MWENVKGGPSLKDFFVWRWWLAKRLIVGKGKKIMDQFYDYILDVSLKKRNHFYAIFGGIHSGGFEISCVKIILYLYILYRVEQTR